MGRYSTSERRTFSSSCKAQFRLRQAHERHSVNDNLVRCVCRVAPAPSACEVVNSLGQCNVKHRWLLGNRLSKRIPWRRRRLRCRLGTVPCNPRRTPSGVLHPAHRCQHIRGEDFFRNACESCSQIRFCVSLLTDSSSTWTRQASLGKRGHTDFQHFGCMQWKHHHSFANWYGFSHPLQHIRIQVLQPGSITWCREQTAFKSCRDNT